MSSISTENGQSHSGDRDPSAIFRNLNFSRGERVVGSQPPVDFASSAFTGIANMFNVATTGGTQYADIWSVHFKYAYETSIREFLREKLAGRILIDVCGGGKYSEQRGFTTLDLAKKCGVSLLINVDTQLQVPHEGLIVKSAPSDQLSPNILYLNMDALRFLASFDGQANVVMNGIDSFIWENATFPAIMREVERIVPRGGIAFGYNCEPLSDYRNKSNWRAFRSDAWKNSPSRGIWERC